MKKILLISLLIYIMQALFAHNLYAQEKKEVILISVGCSSSEMTIEKDSFKITISSYEELGIDKISSKEYQENFLFDKHWSLYESTEVKYVGMNHIITQKGKELYERMKGKSSSEICIMFEEFLKDFQQKYALLYPYSRKTNRYKALSKKGREYYMRRHLERDE